MLTNGWDGKPAAGEHVFVKPPVLLPAGGGVRSTNTGWRRAGPRRRPGPA